MMEGGSYGVIVNSTLIRWLRFNFHLAIVHAACPSRERATARESINFPRVERELHESMHGAEALWIRMII